MVIWDDNERSPYIAHKHTIEHNPDMAQVLKDIVLMSRHQEDSSVEDDEDVEYVLPEMYYEYPDIELPEYILDESDDELLEALETEALDAYFEHCYEGLCKNKYAYV